VIFVLTEIELEIETLRGIKVLFLIAWDFSFGNEISAYDRKKKGWFAVPRPTIQTPTIAIKIFKRDRQSKLSKL
jgi:hypothetical protein